MQYKLILSALAVILAVSPLQAQQRTGAPRGRIVVVSKTDSFQIVTPAVKTPPAKPAKPLLASNLPVTPPALNGSVTKGAVVHTPPVTPPGLNGSVVKAAGVSVPAVISENNKKGYSHVPLAGEKSYFGDKNDYVKDFVRKYLELHNKTLDNVQNNSTTPFSVIDNVLEKKKLPRELKYLAVIESALNRNAVSHAGAVGTWQLMETTARMMGLTVSRRNDERRDLEKSTGAATRYLELLYSQLNDWLLVIAAYNSGPVPVQRAIDRTGSRNFWDIKQYLPRETQGHVLAFIATASIFENLNKFIGLGTIPLDFKFGKEEDAPTVPRSVSGTPTMVKKSPFSEDELKNMCMARITEPLDLEIVGQEIAVDKKILIRWNLDYEMFVYNTYPTPFYNLRIPKDKLDIFLKKKEAITKRSRLFYSQNN